jgi:hypothetical protein
MIQVTLAITNQVKVLENYNLLQDVNWQRKI